MFGGLKDKIIGRKKPELDYSDLKSGVLGRSALPEPTVREKFGFDRPPQFNDPIQKDPFAREPYPPDPYSQQLPQQSFGQRPDPRMDFGMEQPQSRRNDYDVIDKLNLIESQLSAIRSQTETINERLKNLERVIGARRY